MEDIIIKVVKAKDGFTAEIKGQPITEDGLTPFDAVGKLLRKTKNVKDWVDKFDIIYHPIDTELHLRSVKYFVDQFLTSREADD